MQINNHNINIKSIELDDIVHYDKLKYNTNNHWIDNKVPMDYKFILEQSNTDKWIDLLKPKYKTLTIDNEQHINWLKQASKICAITGKFSNLFTDELNQIIKENESISNFDGNYFVRVNNVSLKYGFHGVGPYNNLKNVLESVVSSIASHSPIKDDTQSLKIYLIEWINILPLNEFRVFVYKNKITAISQQNLYTKVGLDKLENKELIEKISIIINYFDEIICKKINWISNYSYDFAIVDNNKPYFIEINSFGKEYAAGSALFHWIHDYSILYNDANSNIEFRYTV